MFLDTKMKALPASLLTAISGMHNCGNIIAKRGENQLHRTLFCHNTVIISALILFKPIESNAVQFEPEQIRVCDFILAHQNILKLNNAIVCVRISVRGAVQWHICGQRSDWYDILKSCFDRNKTALDGERICKVNIAQ